MATKIKKVGVIGYGRFGRILCDILLKKYQVLIFDKFSIESKDVEFSSLEEVLECFLVFIAVPIRSFEDIIKEEFSKIPLSISSCSIFSQPNN